MTIWQLKELVQFCYGGFGDRTKDDRPIATWIVSKWLEEQGLKADKETVCEFEEALAKMD